MKYHVKVVELFQTVEFDAEFETYDELSDNIRFIRDAIKYACQDVIEKQQQTYQKPTYQKPTYRR